MLNVLVTCGGGFQGLGILKALRDVPGIRTILSDRSADCIGQWMASRLVLAPSVSATEAYLAFIREIAIREDVSAIIPATDLDIEILSTLGAWCDENGIFLAVSSKEILAAGLDKLRLHAFSEQHGIAYLPAYSGALFEPATQPLIAKPRRGSGGKSQKLVAKGDVPQAVLGLSEHYLIQPYISGASEYSVDFAIDEQGQISPLVIRERAVNTGGFSVVARFTDDKRLRDVAEKSASAVAEAGGRGGFNLQFLVVDDVPRLIDLNPRFGTSSVFSLEANVNLVAFALGQQSTAEAFRPKERQAVRLLHERTVPTERMAVKGIVLDLDDTLIDQKRWISEKLHHLLDRFSTTLPNATEFLSVCYRVLEEGNRSRLIDGVASELGLPSHVVPLLIEAYRSFIPDKIHIYNDVDRTLAELKRRGVKIAILTDNPADSQSQKLSRLHSLLTTPSPFDSVVMTAHLGVTKPSKIAFEAVAASLALPPAELAMVGDNLYRDALGALDAGFRSSFLLQRPGTFFNFNKEMNEPAIGERDLQWVTNLDEVLWHIDQ